MTRPRRRPSGDAGSVLLLMLGFAVVLIGLVVVVADVSVALLHQRGVAAAADGAAVAAAQQINEAAFYEKGLAGRVPLDGTKVAETVASYAGQVEPDTSLVGRVEDDGTTVVVEGSRTVDLPFSKYVRGGGVTVRSTARATSPVLG